MPMTNHVRKIVRRPETHPSSLRDSALAGRMPEELLSEQIRRLALFNAVGAALWSYGLVLDTFVLGLVKPGAPRNVVAMTVEVVAIVFTTAMYAYVRYAPHSTETKQAVGLVSMILNAAGVAVLNTWATTPVYGATPSVSWIAVLILVFSMISPTTPRRMLAASLVAASMDPLGVWLAHLLLGVPVPSAVIVLLHFLPNYICAILAIVPAQILQRLGRRLREAQDLGSYRLVELLGQGGMGEVWRAQHRLLARNAAVKLVRPELLGAGNETDTSVVLRRFEREAQATAALSSPHTIRVFDYGITDDGTFYYVMELLSGRDLESLVRDFGPVSADRAIFLLRQVCHSLADAHARGLVHRDIKPANIYACRMGLEYDFIKVLDFGLVKVHDRGSTQTLMTLDVNTTGTPAYMAPEIILGESDVDRRADVYALGCVAYFLLTGQLVFEADTPMKMMMQHVQARPVPPSQRTELPVPPELDAIVLACLEKDPNRRPQNAEELLAIAWGCTSCEGWSQKRAKAWWETYLPEMTGPLTLEDAAPPRREEVHVS
jgi:serine/threonine-protein kinase